MCGDVVVVMMCPMEAQIQRVWRARARGMPNPNIWQRTFTEECARETHDLYCIV